MSYDVYVYVGDIRVADAQKVDLSGDYQAIKALMPTELKHLVVMCSEYDLEYVRLPRLTNDQLNSLYAALKDSVYEHCDYDPEEDEWYE